jgi:hypothetical protein
MNFPELLNLIPKPQPVFHGTEQEEKPLRTSLGGYTFNSAQVQEQEQISIDKLICKSVVKKPMPAGFLTSSGNVYAYVNSVATIRFTIDSGDNFAQLHERTVCVFISPEEAAQHDAESLNQYNIAYKMVLEPDSKYKNISDPSQLPLGAELKLVEKTETGFDTIDASFIPEVGKIPVEKWSNVDISGTHTYIGQKVATLIPTRSAIILRMKNAGKKCGRDDSYFADLEKTLRN